MKKVSINSAIKSGSIYYINNYNDKSFDQLYYFLINGLIEFVEFKKINYIRSKNNEDIPDEYFENKIIELEIRYKNLNKFDTDIGIFSHDNCRLIDSDGYCFDAIPIDENNRINYFIPKVWQNKKLMFLVPNEDTEYYFQILHVDFKEK